MVVDIEAPSMNLFVVLSVLIIVKTREENLSQVLSRIACCDNIKIGADPIF